MFRIIITIYLFLSVANVFADSIEQEFKRKLENVSGKNKTIQCDFIQSKKVKNIKSIINSNGEFYYDNSGLMALIYQSPKGDKVVMNNDDFTIITAGKKIVVNSASNPMMAQISYMMQACMSGDISKFGQGWVMKIENAIDSYKVIITPSDKRIQKYINSMLMSFDKADMTLNILRIEEASGGYTEYKFINKRLNHLFDKKFFNVE